MRDKLEATKSEIFDLVPIQKRRQLGIWNAEKAWIGCACFSSTWSLPIVNGVNRAKSEFYKRQTTA